MSYQCEVIEMTPQAAIALRAITTFHQLPKTIGDGMATLRRYLEEQSVIPAGPMYVKYVGPPAHDFPIEVGIAVTPQAPLASGLEVSQLPGGPAATCVHRGHYADLPHAYRALETWATAEGLSLTGDAYELYLNDSEHTPPAAWLTRVAMPLSAL